jgi:ABC-type sugar transport system ATPase subunit
VAGFVGTPSMNFLEGSMEGGRLQIPGAQPLEVGGRHRDRSGTLVLGVRPDALRRAEGAEEAKLHGRVALVEDLGDRCDIRLEVEGGPELVARRPASELEGWEALAAGTVVPLTFDREEAHLFEAGPHGARCG